MHRFFLTIARLGAILGGIVLTVLVVLTVVSVTGRGLNGLFHADWLVALAPGLAQRALDAGVGPVQGDFELVEAGIAFAIMAFLPLAQITGAHATVDIFTQKLPAGLQRGLIAFWEVLFAVALVVISWRLYEGMSGKMRYNETTLVLQFPVWWAYGACFAASVLAAVVGVYVALVRCAELATGRVIIGGDAA
ncbi:TRAP transporter small permease [Pseudooceanicola sp. C21-150M6]|uniref:TRAP transporter small permease n=1 Tax=Pseudooceanicola sp. C21-150M6 TaxID=3434355 RepID=UPI003D7FE709